MAETHSLRLEIDGSAARRGAADYAAAIKKIETATQRMVSATDTSLSRLERRIGNVNFSKIASSISVLNGIKVNRQTVFAIDALSKSLSSIVGVRPVAVKTINDFSAALRSIQTSNINLKRINDISSAMSSFRAPTQTQLRNLQSFVNVINNLRPPANAGSVVAQIQRITNAINQLRASMQALNTGGPGTLRLPRVVGGGVTGGGAAAAGGGGSGGGWTYRYGGTLRQGNAPIPAWMGMGPGRSSVAGMRGFENQFSLPYQAGSAIRSAAGALTVGNFLQQVVQATDDTQKFRSALTALGQSSEDVEAQMGRVRDVVRAYGMNLRETQDMFASFTHAVTSTGVAMESAESMFSNASLSMRAMGMDRVQQEGAFRALGQMFSKGRIMSEELFGQLAEHWRGFPGMIAESLNVTLPQLREAIEKNGLDPRVLELVIERYRQSMEGAIDSALNRPTVAIERLRTEWQLLLSDMGEGAVGQALTSELNRLRDIVASPEFRDFAFKIGTGLADVIRAVGSAAFWATQNIETLSTVLKTLVIVAGANAVIGLGGAFANLARPIMVVIEVLRSMSGGLTRVAASAGSSASALGGLGVVLRTILGFLTGPVGASIAVLSGVAAAIAYAWDETLTWGRHTTTVGDVIKTVWSESVSAVSGFVSAAWDLLSSFGSRVLQLFRDIGATIGATISDTLVGRAIAEFGRGVGQAGSWVAGQFRGAVNPVVEPVVARAAAATAQRNAFRAQEETAAGARRDLQNQQAFGAAERAAGVDDDRLPTPPIPPGRLQDYLLNNGRGGAAGRRASERFTDFRSSLDPSFRVAAELAEGLEMIRAAEARGQVTTAESIALQGRLRDSLLESAGVLDPSARAQQRLNEVIGLANGLLEQRIITEERHAQIIETARLNLEEQLNPYEYQLRLMREETELLGMSSRQMEVEQRVRRIVNDLKRDGVIVTDEMTAALRREAEANTRAAKAQRDSEEGLASWANSFGSIDVELRKLESTIATDLTDALAEFVTTGKASFNDLAQSIVRDINRLIIQNGIRELARSLGLISGDNSSGFSGGGLTGAVGGLFSGIFGSGGLFGGGEMARPSPDFIGPMPSSGGLLSAVGSWLASFFQEGGVSTNPVSRGLMPASAFVNAPHYAEGTANTRGGIPAVLHPNEAVIPLSRNRRVPVEMKGGGGGATIVMNISTPDANSFRKSQAQIARDFGTAFNRQMSRNT